MQELDLHVTNRCRDHCAHCNVNAPSHVEEIDTSLLLMGLEDAASLGAEHLHVTGGEPFLRKDILEILGKARSLGMAVEIITGIRLDESTLCSLKDMEISYLAVSIDGDRSYHDGLRHDGSFDDAIHNIRHATEIGLRTRVNTTVWKDNLDLVPGVAQLTSEVGVDKHVLFYFTPIGRGSQHLDRWMNLEEWSGFLDPTKDQLRDILLKLPATSPKIDYILQKGYVRSREQWGDSEVCRIRSRSSSVMMCNGNIYPCVFFMNEGPSLGNIADQPLPEIWNSSPVWNWYDETSFAEGSECRTCVDAGLCKGGCPGYAFLLAGDVTAGDPRCLRSNRLLPGCAWLTERVMERSR